MSTIEAPWTAEQVDALNRYQQAGRFHPFTCGKRDQHPADEGLLVATEQGWRCPADGCDYRQNWAHAFMVLPLPEDRARDILAKMRADRLAGKLAVEAVARIRAKAEEWAALAPADDWGATPTDTTLADAGRYLLVLIDHHLLLALTDHPERIPAPTAKEQQ